VGAAFACIPLFFKRDCRDCLEKEFFLFTNQPINYSTNQPSLQGETSKIEFLSLN
jgi:hypothetical protein